MVKGNGDGHLADVGQLVSVAASKLGLTTVAGSNHRRKTG